jgi:hypothetical protein
MIGGGSAGNCIDGAGGDAGHLMGYTLRNVKINTTFEIKIGDGNVNLFLG